MAHLIIKADFNLVKASLKNCENCFHSEDEIQVIISEKELNIPLTIRPHGEETTIVRVDNFPIFVDEIIIERALKEFADRLNFKIKFENFSRKGGIYEIS